jgi:hypothetical protein
VGGKVIRGAFLFGTGLVIGYSFAMSQVPEAKQFLQSMQSEWESAKKASSDISNEGEVSS